MNKNKYLCPVLIMTFRLLDIATVNDRLAALESQ
jgi:hypothetical protein